MTNQKKWLKSSQLDLVESPEKVDANHKSTIRKRLEDKVNGHLPQILTLFPKLTRFLTPDTTERIQQETDPVLLGHALGGLYPKDQRLDLIHGLVWQERDIGESREDFLERFPEVIAEMEEEVTTRAQNAHIRTETRSMAYRLRKQLLDRIGEVVSDVTHSAGMIEEGEGTSTPRISMRVSEYNIAEWIRKQDWDNERITYLPALLECIRPTGQIYIEQALRTYRDTLVEAAETQNIEVPAGWAADSTEFAATNAAGHQTLLTALDDEIRHAVAQYWEEQRIEEKDQLLQMAVDVLDDLNDRQLKILARDPEERNNRADGWNRHDTRLANALTEDGELVDYPLLKSEEAASGKKAYQLTTFGEFVNMFQKYNSYDPMTAGFPDEIPADVVDGALKEVNRS